MCSGCPLGSWLGGQPILPTGSGSATSGRSSSYPRVTPLLASWGSPCSKIPGVSLGWGRAEHLWGPECDCEEKSRAGPFPGSAHGQALLQLVALESIQELVSSVGYFG